MNRQRIIRVLRKLSAVVAVLPLIFSFILSYFQPTPRDNGESLQFDGEFVILAFSGLFLKEDTRFLEEKISEHRPDLVLLCGDNVFPQTLVSDLLFAGTMRIIDKYIGVFEKQKTYFSALFGTYDIAGLFDKSAQLKRFMRSDYFVGGVQDSQSVKVMSANKKSHGNFRISIIVEGETYYIYVVDSSGGELGADSKEWIKDTADKPYIMFSYSGGDAPSENAVAQFFVGDEDAPFCIRQSGVYDRGEVRYAYAAKKIVLTASGELFESVIE